MGTIPVPTCDYILVAAIYGQAGRAREFERWLAKALGDDLPESRIEPEELCALLRLDGTAAAIVRQDKEAIPGMVEDLILNRYACFVQLPPDAQHPIRWWAWAHVCEDGAIRLGCYLPTGKGKAVCYDRRRLYANTWVCTDLRATGERIVCEPYLVN